MSFNQEPKSRIELHRLAGVPNQILCLCYLFLWTMGLMVNSTTMIVLIIGTLIARICLDFNTSPLRFISYVYLVYLYAIPEVGYYMQSREDALPYLAMTIILSDVIVYLGDRAVKIGSTGKPNAGYRSSRFDLIIWLFLLAASTVGGSLVPGDNFLGSFVFIAPYGLSLIYLERLVIVATTFRLLIFVFCYTVAVAVYIVVFWSGYGRLVVGSYILMPILLISQYRDIYLRSWMILPVAPVALYYAHMSRYGTQATAADLAGGSASHHLELTLSLAQSNVYQYYGGVGRFFGQYSLMFFNWVPRIMWESKPIGLGYAAVDEWIGRLGYGEGFSVSLGMFGEQIYIWGGGLLAATDVCLVFISDHKAGCRPGVARV